MPLVRTPYTPRKYRFGRHDRLRIDGACYRVERSENGLHRLQLVTDDIVQDHHIVKSDDDISALLRAKRIFIDEGYYSEALLLVKNRETTVNIINYFEAELRTMTWKLEWCVRFNKRRLDMSGAARPRLTEKDFQAFIDQEKDALKTWYFETYGEMRPAGRQRPDGSLPKDFDYPSASTLKLWMKQFRVGGNRIEAFAPRYENSGRKPFLDPVVREIVERRAQDYAASNRPSMAHVIESVRADLDEYNARNGTVLSVSDTYVRSAINRIDPFIRDAGRHGVDRAIRKYAGVGKGIAITVPGERVEIDDWEFDLMALLATTSAWRKMDQKQRASVPRIRATFTAAIDVATRCIVGLSLSPSAPSVAGSKSCLCRVVQDKSQIARWSGCRSEWPMALRPDFIATDGGPAFRGEFDEAVRQIRSNRTIPEQDPRMRGTIESFFKMFKRVCRYFAGQTFANVVKRGEYNAEANATLPFETLFKSAVRYVVDYYHHKPHRGLEGGTPAAAWARLTAEHPMPPLPGDMQIMSAFGFRDTRKLSAAGIAFETLRYASETLAALHRKCGNAEVTISIDPHDLSHILVRIPPQLTGATGLPSGDWFSVPEVDGAGANLTLPDLLQARSEVINLVKNEEEQGRTIRLAAHRDLLSGGERERKAAGIDDFGLTQKQFDMISNVVKHKEAAAFMPPPDDTEARRSDAFSQPPKTPSSSDKKPFGGSINTFGDDE